MPYIDDGKETEYYGKSLSKKKEEELRKKGFKPYDVRIGISFPKGEKMKVWAKNRDDAATVGNKVADGIMLDPKTTGGITSIKEWPKGKKTRMKRKNSKRFKPVKVERIHPKTGKKFTQTVYKHTKEWYYHDK